MEVVGIFKGVYYKELIKFNKFILIWMIVYQSFGEKYSSFD